MKNSTRLIGGILVLVAIMPIVTPYIVGKQVKKNLSTKLMSRAIKRSMIAGYFGHRNWWEGG